MRVLLVDDSLTMRRIVAQALKKAGCEDIVEAENGEQAVTKVAADTNIGLVLMDWNMPEMNGIDALKAIRSSGSKVPIVMVTTEAEQDKVLQAIKSGANDYLAKPFAPADIAKKLEKFLTA